MAKRFTDTAKWDKGSFMELSPKMKLAWDYLCDKCDHAGVWDINVKLMSVQIGWEYSLEEILEGLGDKVELRGSKLFLPSFIEFQYGNLNPENRVHKSILDRVEKLSPKSLSNTRPTKPHPSPIQGAMEMDMEMELEMEMERGGAGGVAPAARTGIPTEIKAEWEATLSHYGRSVNWARDEAPLMRAYLRVKDWLRVRSAIVGFRRETKSGDYDPAKHCHLRRLEDPKSFDFLEGLGDLPEGGATPKRDYSFLEDVS